MLLLIYSTSFSADCCCCFLFLLILLLFSFLLYTGIVCYSHSLSTAIGVAWQFCCWFPSFSADIGVVVVVYSADVVVILLAFKWYVFGLASGVPHTTDSRVGRK